VHKLASSDVFVLLYEVGYTFKNRKAGFTVRGLIQLTKIMSYAIMFLHKFTIPWRNIL